MKLPFWGTVLTVLGVVILCGLGAWQLQRLAWKEDILTKLDAAYEGEVTKLDFDTINADDFAYGVVEGRFLFDSAILLGYRVKDGVPGADLIVPLETDQGVLFVNMGFNPGSQSLDGHFLDGYQGDMIRFTGLARAPEWNAFTPENVPEEGLWYRADVEEMAAVKGLSDPVPVVLYADFASRKFDAQFPNNERWEPKNNHLQYAIFWFTMAAAMVVVYGVRFLRKR